MHESATGRNGVPCPTVANTELWARRLGTSRPTCARHASSSVYSLHPEALGFAAQVLVSREIDLGGAIGSEHALCGFDDVVLDAG
jgi:hypothetical protein